MSDRERRRGNEPTALGEPGLVTSVPLEYGEVPLAAWGACSGRPWGDGRWATGILYLTNRRLAWIRNRFAFFQPRCVQLALDDVKDVRLERTNILFGFPKNMLILSTRLGGLADKEYRFLIPSNSERPIEIVATIEAALELIRRGESEPVRTEVAP